MAIEGALQAPLPINNGPVLYPRTVVYGLSQKLFFVQVVRKICEARIMEGRLEGDSLEKGTRHAYRYASL